MRTKTLNQIAQEAAEYAVETIDIERALVVKQTRDEERASVKMRTGVGDDIVNICRESALLIAADLVRLDSHLTANIESELYAYLENLPSYSSLYKNRLDAELAEDQRIISAVMPAGSSATARPGKTCSGSGAVCSGELVEMRCCNGGR